LVVGSVRTTIGRHSEVVEGTVEALYKQQVSITVHHDAVAR